MAEDFTSPPGWPATALERTVARVQQADNDRIERQRLEDRARYAPLFQAPDFLMLGVQQSDGTCFIFASKDLSNAELRSEMDQFDMQNLDRYCNPKTRHFVNAEMRTWVMVQGRSYSHCLGELLRTWQPDEAPQGYRSIGP